MISYFNSASQPAALPAMTGQPGAAQSVFRAVLTTGAAVANVQSLVVSGGVATATYAADPGYIVDNLLSIDGATPTDINGLARVLSRPTPNSATFSVSAPDGAASGSITSRIASAGWDETFTSGTSSVFRPSAVESLGMSFRIDDAGTTTARICGYEDMSSVDTGSGPIPTPAQVAGGLWMLKSYTADSFARPWIAAADDRGVLIMTAWSSRYVVQYIGDIDAQWSADTWAWLITGCATNQSGAPDAVVDACCGYSQRSGRAGAYVARGVSAPSQGAVAAIRVGAGHNGSAAGAWSGGAGYGHDQIPNPAGFGLLLTPVEIWAGGLRGRIPGLYHVRGLVGLDAPVVIDGSHELLGRRLLLVPVGQAWGPTVAKGVVAVDLTGPWPRDGA